ncbi:MAG TPA: LON peptidase substrate-binding domain-containing protein, partial [Agitococcus sp.]|nr:LON peptidase substrate-binding domain-containing protein [Agitococcus sp.]HNL79626.1 LON peptidase substrate-binding domain-containing protein [Agitococcus sp.]
MYESELLDLPLLPLRDVVVYPHMVIPLFVGREKSIQALEAAMAGHKKIFVVAQRDAADDDPQQKDLYDIGTVATILQLLKLPDGTVKVLVEGQRRAQVDEINDTGRYLLATVRELNPEPISATQHEALVRSIMAEFEQYVKQAKKVAAEVLTSVQSIKELPRLTDTIAAHLALKLEEKQQILELTGLEERVEHLLGVMESEVDLLKVEKRIRGRVKKQMEKTQREYYLN